MYEEFLWTCPQIFHEVEASDVLLSSELFDAEGNCSLLGVMIGVCQLDDACKRG